MGQIYQRDLLPDMEIQKNNNFLTGFDASGMLLAIQYDSMRPA